MTSHSRIDLHCHSSASERAGLGVQRSLGLPECATPPEEVYELAKRRGMDFVTITDHDTIEGALAIADRADTFVSVELTARFKGEPQAVHVLCFGLSPDDHARLQAHAGDVEACAEYLDANEIACALAHPFVPVAVPLESRHTRRLAELFPTWELRNGARPPESNAHAALVADARGGGGTGGSDDHAGIDVGRTWTELPAAASPAEALAHLRAGRCAPGGADGSVARWAHAALALAVRTVGLADGDELDPLRVALIAQALAERRPDEVEGLEPRDARALVGAWLRSVGIEADTPAALLSLLQSDGFDHADLERRARRSHERALANAVRGTLGRDIAARRYGEVALELFHACIPAVPYIPPAAIAARDRSATRLRRSRPRVGLVVEAISGVHGVTRNIEQIRERGVPGFDVEVIGTDAGVDRRLPAVAEVEIPFYSGLSVGIPSLHAVVETLAERHYDLLHLTSPGPVVAAALAVGRLTDTPVVFSYDTELAAYVALRSGDETLASGLRNAMAAAYSLARLVLSPSRSADASLRELGVPVERIARWDRGVDMARFDPAPQRVARADGSLSILYAGRLTTEKGIHLLAEAYLAARERHPGLGLTVAGGGPEEAWLQARLGTQVSFLGWLPPPALARAYADADIFLFPSSTDTFGQVVLEAQASGLPVVAVNAGGPADLIDHRATGLLCPPEPDALADAIVELARSPFMRARVGSQARAAARERSWEAALARLAAAYERALAEPVETRRAA